MGLWSKISKLEKLGKKLDFDVKAPKDRELNLGELTLEESIWLKEI